MQAANPQWRYPTFPPEYNRLFRLSEEISDRAWNNQQYHLQYYVTMIVINFTIRLHLFHRSIPVPLRRSSGSSSSAMSKKNGRSHVDSPVFEFLKKQVNLPSISEQAIKPGNTSSKFVAWHYQQPHASQLVNFLTLWKSYEAARLTKWPKEVKPCTERPAGKIRAVFSWLETMQYILMHETAKSKSCRKYHFDHWRYIKAFLYRYWYLYVSTEWYKKVYYDWMI